MKYKTNTQKCKTCNNELKGLIETGHGYCKHCIEKEFDEDDY